MGTVTTGVAAVTTMTTTMTASSGCSADPVLSSIDGVERQKRVENRLSPE
jgi:hypothetical protein